MSHKLLVQLAVLFVLLSTFTSKPHAAEISNLTGLKFRIETASMEESLKFYTKLLGLTILEQWDEQDDRGAILGLDSKIDGTAFLELGYSQEPKSFSGVSIQIRVHSLADVLKNIEGKVEFSGPEERPWGSKYLYLTDPNLVSVILYEGKL